MFQVRAYDNEGVDHASDATVAVRVGPRGVTLEYQDGTTLFLAGGELELRVDPPELEQREDEPT